MAETTNANSPEKDNAPHSPEGEEAAVSAEHAQSEASMDGQSAADGDTTTDAADSPEQRLDAAQAELNQAKDQLLRAVADSQNAQRRAQAEVEKARKYAVEKFAGDMLPVVDNLERAIEAAGDDVSSPIHEGVLLTLKGLQDALKKHNVDVVDPHGEPFDPELHQAMSMVPNPEVEPNTVIAVMQKGYTLNGRLLRPAMVMVAKAP